MKVNPGILTNALALQLHLLREDTGCTWDQLEKFFQKTVVGDPLAGLNLQTEIRATLKDAKLCLSEEQLDDVLKVDLGFMIKGRNTGFHLLKHGIGRPHLLDPEKLASLDASSHGAICNGIIVDLYMFK